MLSSGKAPRAIQLEAHRTVLNFHGGRNVLYPEVAAYAMPNTFLDTVIISRAEAIVVAALKLLLIVLIIIAASVDWLLFVRSIPTHFTQIDSVQTFIPQVQSTFAGVLTVVLGLELLETLRAYFHDHHVKLEVILIVAIIAVARQVIQADLEHAAGFTLLGFAGVIVSLTLGYFFIAKARNLEKRIDT